VSGSGWDAIFLPAFFREEIGSAFPDFDYPLRREPVEVGLRDLVSIEQKQVADFLGGSADSHCWFDPAYLASDLGCSEAIRDVALAPEALGRVRAPTLVIAGAHDAAMPPRLGQAIAQAVPGARYAELPVAHIPHIADPAPFLDLVLEHLR